MRKPIKKIPAKKRKGYDSGGWVDPLGDQLADTHNRTSAAQGGRLTPEQSERYIAARGAMVSATANKSGSSTAAGDNKLWGSGTSGSRLQEGGRTVELGRADYPGFRKGGKVKKVIPAKKKARR